MADSNNIINFTHPDHGGFSIDISTGEVDLFPDIDPIYWANYLTSFWVGLANKLEDAFPGASRSPIGVKYATLVVNVFAVAEKMENAETARETIQIFSAGVVDIVRGYATGMIFGHLLGAIIVAEAPIVFPLVIGAVLLAGIDIAFGDNINDLLQTLVTWSTGRIYDNLELLDILINSPPSKIYSGILWS